MTRTLTHRRRRLAVALVCALLVALAAAAVPGYLALTADPAWGDDRPAGEITEEGARTGTRWDPALVGEDTLHWSTADGGEVSLTVDRTEVVGSGSPDLRPGWEGPFPCQEVLVVALTVAYTGAGSWDPTDALSAMRRDGAFGTDRAWSGAEILADPSSSTTLR